MGAYCSSCNPADLCPRTLCWRAGLCFAELVADGGPLYSKINFNIIKSKNYKGFKRMCRGKLSHSLTIDTYRLNIVVHTMWKKIQKCRTAVPAYVIRPCPSALVKAEKLLWHFGIKKKKDIYEVEVTWNTDFWVPSKSWQRLVKFFERQYETLAPG